MKALKTAYLALAMVMAIGFSACGNDKNATAAQGSASNTSELPEGAQPGAKVERRINENGDSEYSYQNSDGSAGGGVELD